MPTQYIRGANTTAQWYQAKYPSATTFPRIDKFLIHTTETTGWPGYGGGASAPTATYHPRLRQIRQHFGINRSARALRDPSSTAVRENRDNVFQLEVICYSDFILAKKVGGLWVGDLTTSHMRDIAAIALQCADDWGLPLTSTVRWREGRQGYYNDVRLSGSQFDAYRGILGHVHASGNTHWDPGGFRYSQLKAALSWQLVNHPVYGGGTTIPDPSVPGGGFDPEEDMPLNDADKKWLADQMMATAKTFFGGRSEIEYNGVRRTRDDNTELLTSFVGKTLNAVLYQVLPALEANDFDIDKLAEAIVAKIPTTAGSIDLETVKAGVRAVLTEGVGDAPA